VEDDGIAFEDERVELNEDNDDSALGIHFGDSDDELMLNDNFEFEPIVDE
jgi:hypothetical protein